MAQEQTPAQPQSHTPNQKTEIAPLCDEASGGGGSATDTRDRGMPGGSPADEGDCKPIARPTPTPTPDEDTP